MERNYLSIIGEIDAGNFGKIFLAKKYGGIDNEKTYAVKRVVPVDQTAQEYKKVCMTELEVFKIVLNTEFFIQLKYACKAKSLFHFVMDYQSSGNMFNHLHHVSHLTPEETIICVGEIVLGLQYLHERQIVYRDLKLENILIDDQNHILLSDFGLARELKTGERLHDFSGTVTYMAPEIINQKKGHSFEVDWWCLGIITHELLVGHSPFLTSINETVSDAERSARIMAKRPLLDKLFNETKSEKTRSFVTDLLNKNPMQRLGAGLQGYHQVKSHPYFEQINWLALKLKVYKCLRTPVQNEPVAISFNEISSIQLDSPQSAANTEFFFVEKDMNESITPKPCVGLQKCTKPKLAEPIRPLNLVIKNEFIKTRSIRDTLKRFFNKSIETNENPQIANPRRPVRIVAKMAGTSDGRRSILKVKKSVKSRISKRGPPPKTNRPTTSRKTSKIAGRRSKRLAGTKRDK